eukprot:gene21811-25886_t
MVYALSSWLPKLMAGAGYSLGSSLSFLLALNFGGIAGALVGGWLCDRLNLVKVVIGFFIAALLSISLLGIKSPMPVLYLLIFFAGATTIATGLGWASGIGRTGAIVGPLLGGALMGIELPLHLNFMAFAIPGAIAVLAMTAYALNERRGRQEVIAAPAQ